MCNLRPWFDTSLRIINPNLLYLGFSYQMDCISPLCRSPYPPPSSYSADTTAGIHCSLLADILTIGNCLLICMCFLFLLLFSALLTCERISQFSSFQATDAASDELAVRRKCITKKNTYTVYVANWQRENSKYVKRDNR